MTIRNSFLTFLLLLLVSNACRADRAPLSNSFPCFQGPNPNSQTCRSPFAQRAEAFAIPRLMGAPAPDSIGEREGARVFFPAAFSLPKGDFSPERVRTLIQNVWDDHPREPVTSHKYPWSCIGWIDGATGTMVAPDLVLTAAHVVMDEKTHQLRKDLTYFFVSRVGDEYSKRSWINYVWWGTNNPDNDRAHDWAILKLADRLGDDVGWMGVANTDYFHVANFPSPLTLAGYSGDYDSGNTATVDRNVTIRSISNGLLHHDGSTARGGSGCPIFLDTTNKNGKGEALIYGLNVAENRLNGETSLRLPSYDGEYSNTAVETYTFLGMIKKLRAEKPSAGAVAAQLAETGG